MVTVALLFAHGEVGADIDGEFLLTCPFGRDDNHPVGSPCPVNGGSRGIFQHGNALNVITVDRFQRPFDRQPVHDNQGTGLCLKGTHAPDSKRVFAAFQPVVVAHQPGNLTFKAADNVRRIAVVHLFGRDKLIGTSSTLSLKVLITGNNHLLHHGGVFQHLYHNGVLCLAGNPQFFVVHTYKRKNQYRMATLHRNGKFAVDARCHSRSGILHPYIYARHRYILDINHPAADYFFKILFVRRTDNHIFFHNFIIQTVVIQHPVEDVGQRHIVKICRHRPGTCQNLFLINKIIICLLFQIGQYLFQWLVFIAHTQILSHRSPGEKGQEGHYSKQLPDVHF